MRGRILILALGVFWGAFVGADPGMAAPGGGAGAGAGADWRNPFRCDRAFGSRAEWARSEANLDLANGLAYFGIATGLNLGTTPHRRWTAVNRFDSGAREGLRLNSSRARDQADLASDLALGTSLGILPLLAIGAHQSRTGDCVESWDMLTDYVESFGLTLMISQSLKLASGRARPFTRECGPGAPPDANCNRDDRFGSFTSGHASLAAAGAGLTCAFAIKREAFGSTRMEKAIPCGFGMATALLAGTLRVSADRHWLSDTLVGMAFGAAVGYFDTWGPLDWLKIREKDSNGNLSLLGVVVPTAVEGRFGAQLMLIF